MLSSFDPFSAHRTDGVFLGLAFFLNLCLLLFCLSFFLFLFLHFLPVNCLVCQIKTLTQQRHPFNNRLFLFFVLVEKSWKSSSLYCNISLSFLSFLYNGVYFDELNLSVNDVIISQKSSSGDRKRIYYLAGL